ncbi:MAG: type II toxin-antitoxin system HicA family toxin [Rhodospirillales bacterium]
MNAKARKTLQAVFRRPTSATIAWTDIEALFRALGSEISEGSGSRVRVRLGNGLAVFHRPHPQKEAKKSLVEAVRLFLSNNGITP